MAPYKLQFLDLAGNIVRAYRVPASDVRGAVEALKDLRWPAGTARVSVLDALGRIMHVEMLDQR